MVQPTAVTPPKPIKAAPTKWLAVSSTPRNDSQRKFLLRMELIAEPMIMPITATMPMVKILDLSLVNIIQSKAKA